MIDNNIYKWLQLAGNSFSFTFNIKDKKRIKLAISLIKEELKELELAIEREDEVEVLDAIADLHWVKNNLTYFMGITSELMDAVLKEVSDSNYSKFTNKINVAADTVLKYKKGIHPDKPEVIINTKYTKEGDMYIIRRIPDDKILKSIDYRPANIKKILEKYRKEYETED
jgi:hypothetical protein